MIIALHPFHLQNKQNSMRYYNDNSGIWVFSSTTPSLPFASRASTRRSSRFTDSYSSYTSLSSYLQLLLCLPHPREHSIHLLHLLQNPFQTQLTSWTLRTLRFLHRQQQWWLSRLAPAKRTRTNWCVLCLTHSFHTHRHCRHCRHINRFFLCVQNNIMYAIAAVTRYPRFFAHAGGLFSTCCTFQPCHL